MDTLIDKGIDKREAPRLTSRLLNLTPAKLSIHLTHWLSQCRSSALARNTFYVFLGQGLRVLIQAAYFIIIARSLGSQQYGAFVSVTAFIQILFPFVGVGCSILND
jgi:hypothetical protein